MKRILILLPLMLFFLFSAAQYDLTERKFEDMDVKDVIATSQGYYFLAIRTDQTEADQVITNHYTSKLVFLDRNLQKRWEKTFPPGESPTLTLLKQVHDRLYLVGSSNDSRYQDIKAWLVCTDLLGNTIWERQYAFAGQLIVEGNGIYAGPQGELILHGHAFKQENSVGKPVLYRLDANGNVLWQKMYGLSAYYPSFSKGIFSSQGTLAFTGFVYPDAQAFHKTNQFKGYAVKIDPSNGSVLWEKQFGGGGYIDMRDVVEDQAGNLMVLGTMGSNCVGRQARQWILAADGSLLAQNTLSDKLKTSFEHICIDQASGNIYATGVFEKNTSGNSDFVTLFARFDQQFQLVDVIEINAENALQLRLDTDGMPFALGKKSLLYFY